MNPIPFIILGVVVGVLPFLGFPRATEDILISLVGFMIAILAVIKMLQDKKDHTPHLPLE